MNCLRLKRIAMSNLNIQDAAFSITNHYTLIIGCSIFITGCGIRQVIASYNSRTISKLSSSSKSIRKKSPIYTKTGDGGMSSLYNGERRKKCDAIFEALGHQDELNASIGIAREHCVIANNGIDHMLIEIQSRLFDLGACVATPFTNSSDEKLMYTQFSNTFTLQLEEWIDQLDADLPPLQNFILPSGGFSAVHLNMSRTICRRAERAVVPLVNESIVDKEVGRYLNRLSDFLFVAMRTAAYREQREETIWKKGNI